MHRVVIGGGETMRKKKKPQKVDPRKKLLSLYEVNNILEKARVQLANETFIILIAITSMVLHDEFGFGKKRLETFVEQACRKYNDLDSGLYSVDDAKTWFEEYTGMQIKKIS